MRFHYSNEVKVVVVVVGGSGEETALDTSMQACELCIDLVAYTHREILFHSSVVDFPISGIWFWSA